MRVLLTGATSFTGHWFALELAERGHDVTVALWNPREHYNGVRQQRLERLAACCRIAVEAPFGGEAFLQLLNQPWDLFCHHAAQTKDYRSEHFSPLAAVETNAHNIDEVCRRLQAGGCRKMLLTGSFFESGEGAGSDGLPAFSAYGLSKSLTADVFRFYARRYDMRLGKFVISNPFGPYEEPRFASYLAKNWLAGETPEVRTPCYVRDNIHVSLLAKSYALFAGQLSDEAGFEQVNPSGYVESQGDFAKRMCREMSTRWDLPCSVDLAEQTKFEEPRIRINTDAPDVISLRWDESSAWDALAEYYEATFGKHRQEQHCASTSKPPCGSA